jgi:hypothetical protein
MQGKEPGIAEIEPEHVDGLVQVELLTQGAQIHKTPGDRHERVAVWVVAMAKLSQTALSCGAVLSRTRTTSPTLLPHISNGGRNETENSRSAVAARGRPEFRLRCRGDRAGQLADTGGSYEIRGKAKSTATRFVARRYPIGSSAYFPTVGTEAVTDRPGFAGKVVVARGLDLCHINARRNGEGDRG